MIDRLNVAIVGAGIGGLAAALALSARGIDVSVFEEAESAREAGAGISIPPNAAILLKRTRLCNEIERITTRSQGLTLRTSRGVSVAEPAATPAMQSYQIHRVEILNMLHGALKAAVRFGHRCVAVNETKIGARLTFANGAVCDADVVIGADGIHSIVQREMGLTTSPTSEGIVAYRGLLQAQKLSLFRRKSAHRRPKSLQVWSAVAILLGRHQRNGVQSPDRKRRVRPFRLPEKLSPSLSTDPAPRHRARCNRVAHRPPARPALRLGGRQALPFGPGQMCLRLGMSKHLNDCGRTDLVQHCFCVDARQPERHQSAHVVTDKMNPARHWFCSRPRVSTVASRGSLCRSSRRCWPPSATTRAAPCACSKPPAPSRVRAYLR